MVALGNSRSSFLNPATAPVLSIPDLGIPYYLPEVLDRVLELVLQMAACDVGWLAIRSGDFFEIKAYSNCKDCSEERISIEANPLLREIINTGSARLLEKEDAEWSMVPRIGYKELYKHGLLYLLLSGSV